jgi:hypothetical protein
MHTRCEVDVRAPCLSLGGVNKVKLASATELIRKQHRLLREQIRTIAHQRRRFGYRRVHDILKQRGVHVNHKRVYRLYTEQKLAVKRQKG